MDMTETIRAVRLRVSGRVQGVGYRAWTAAMAQALGLSGWVRNCRDGTVEALFAGPADAVAAALSRCHDGPRASRVTAIAVEEERGPVSVGFEIRPTL
jgi:acylphosphatase